MAEQGRAPAPEDGRAEGSRIRITATELSELRTLFWHNVVREMLTGLAAAAVKHPDLLDGRFGVLTRSGERIPIAQVEPVFGMSVRGSDEDRDASSAVQMTVFRIATPEGEVFTLPVSEIRGFHELTPELLERLEQAEREADDPAGRPGSEQPFGLAAFRALPRVQHGPAPDHPME